MAMSTNHKAIISNLRSSIKSAGFKASVSGFGSDMIRVCTTTYDNLFTADQIAVFAGEAINNGLTHVMGTSFTVESESVRTGSSQFNYFINE